MSFDEVTNDYYHPELIRLYKRILEDLDFKIINHNHVEYICFNFKEYDYINIKIRFNYLNFDNKKMVLVDENRDFAIK